MSYTITTISDTHSKHYLMEGELPGGDILIHAGDFSSVGGEYEVDKFLGWFDLIDNYTFKILIAGNHDFIAEEDPEKFRELLSKYKSITYLEDSSITLGLDRESIIKVYGSPYQPEFNSWAFNLPKHDSSLPDKWGEIEDGVDILITHGPPFGILDKNQGGMPRGCHYLNKEISERVKPKIHIFGHIHEDYGYRFLDGILYINASFLKSNYSDTNTPITFEWDPESNEFNFLTNKI